MTGARAHDRADDFAAIDQRCLRAEYVVRLVVMADQDRLGATDRRALEDDPEVGGDAEAPRVGVAVPVDQDDVRFVGEPRQGIEHRRTLAEGKKTRNVGELHRGPGDHGLASIETWEGETDRRRVAGETGVPFDVAV